MIGVIFCEGKNDNYFIGEVFDRECAGFYEREFNAENISNDEVTRKESETIRRFIKIRRGERAILLKSEQGKPELEDAAAMYIPRLAEKDVFQAVVIDLDRERTFGEVISTLESKINSRISGSVELTKGESTIRNRDFIGRRLKYHVNNQLIDSFGVLAFYDDVEAAAGIEGIPSSESRREGIRNYIDNNPELASDAISIIF